MSSKADLIAAIDLLLGLSAAGRLLQLNSDTAAHAYEAYVLALCTQAVQACGGTAVLTGATSGPTPAVVVFRGSPGDMSSTTQDFCFVDCELGSRRFEIHVDVIYEGRSGANHEIDVSLCLKRHALDVRAHGFTPRANGNVVAAIECKFYGSTPGVALARTFVGLLSDCNPSRLKAFASNQGSDGLDLFLGTKKAPQPFTTLSPLAPQAEARFRAVLEQMLGQWMRAR